MNKIALLALVSMLLAGCKIDLTIFGEGTVTSQAPSNFDCDETAGPKCSHQYTSPQAENLIAAPKAGYTFSSWENCNYKTLFSCELLIIQDAIDDNEQLTVTATFKEIVPPIKDATYTYNALGQRMTKTVDGVTTLFQYDLEGNLIAELDSSGQPLRQHVHVYSEPIAQLTASDNTVAIQFVHADHLGTPTLLTNESGVVVADIEATPFGELYVDYAAVTHNRRLPGQYKDEESGLHYNYFRDYDPSLGRYIQSDPIGLQGGLNTYAYVGGNPLIYTDPYGLEAWVNAFPNKQGGFNFTAHDNMGSSPVTGNFNNNTTNINQIRPGTYTVTPRPVLPNTLTNLLFNRNANAGNPTISNTNDWNTIRYSNGDNTTGAQFHEGRNGTSSGLSQACMVSDRGTNNALRQMFERNYDNGGVTLIVYPPNFMGF